MKILLTTDVIHAGGAETFVLRLSQGLVSEGHNVCLYILYKNKVDHQLVKSIAPDVRLITGNLKGIRLLQILDGLMLRLKIDFSFVNRLLEQHLALIIKRERIELVHSHLFTADRIAIAAAKIWGKPVVTTMHGDYSLIWNKVDRGVAIRILNYKKKMREVLRQLTAIVCISEEQLHFFNEFKKELSGVPLKKIYNGYQLANEQKHLSKTDLKIPEDSFVFGMVARGIPEKGWQPVLDAFVMLNKEKTTLLLIGDSEYVQERKKDYAQYKNIIFAGYSKNPVEYIRLFDVALFASTYGAESLPTVLMEYMACEVPIISTDIAECSAMLQAEGNMAGILVPLHHGQVKVEDMAGAMRLLLNDSTLYQSLRHASLKAFAKFNMQHCVNEYLDVYKQAISAT